MKKNTLEQYTPETEKIIQWVDAFNHEEELNKINKYLIKPQQKNIKVVQKINFSMNDDTNEIFNIIELKTEQKPTPTPQQKNNIKTVQKIKIEDDEELKIKYVNYKEIKEYSLNITNKYLPISKQVKNGYIYSLIPIDKKQKFINQYLKTNNNLYEIITNTNKIKFYLDIENKLITTEEEANKKLKNLIEFVKIKINEIFKIKINDDEIIILNSCSINGIFNKFSFHIIIKSLIFENKQILKIFINYLVNVLKNDVYYNHLIGDIIDDSIYSSNRNFRFINQSKYNDERILINNDINIDDTFINIYENNNNNFKIIKDKDIDFINISDAIKPKSKEEKQRIKKILDENFNINDDKEAYINLKTIKNLTYDDLYKFTNNELYKRYLYLINQPKNINHPSTWKIYFIIACSLAKIGAPKADFIEWCKLNPLFNEDDQIIKDYETKLKSHDINKGYNINSLRKLAKICDPEFFKESPYELNQLLYNLNLNNSYYIINETTKYINENNNIKLMDKEDIIFKLEQTRIKEDNSYNIYDKFIFLLAHMGKGKTKFILNFLRLHKDKKILFISSRCTFADYVEGDFNEIGLINYQSLKKNEITEDKIIISLESIHKLKHYDYDYIILDECETVFKNLDGETMKGKQLKNFDILKQLITNSKKCIVADAFLSNRSINFFNQYEENKTLIINEIPIIEREAVELHEEQILNKMIEKLKEGKNIYCVYGSERKLRQHIKYIQDEGILKREEILYYCSTSDDKNKELLKNVNKTWVNYKMIATSPTISVGVSFSKEYFNNTFIVGYPSCTIRDIFQSHQRARVLKDNVIYYSLPSLKTYNFIRAISSRYLQTFFNFDETINNNYELHIKKLLEIEQYINNNNNINFIKHKQDNLNKVQLYKEFLNNLSEIPNDLKEIIKFNILEQATSNLNYNYIFRSFLLRCNYKIDKTLYKDYDHDEEKKYKDDEERIKTSGEGYKEKENKILTDNEANIIKEKIKNKTASEPEKINIDRYFFKKLINNNDTEPELFDELYIKFWESKHNRHIIKNIKAEILNKYEFIKIKNDEYEEKINDDINKDSFTKADLKNKALKLHHINKIKDFLNIESSFNNEQVTRDDINCCIKYLNKERNNIYNIFECTDQKKTKDELNFNTGLKTINKIFNSFNGCLIKGDITNYNKKSKTFNNYIIEKSKAINEIEELHDINIYNIFNTYNDNLEIHEDYNQYLFIE